MQKQNNTGSSIVLQTGSEERRTGEEVNRGLLSSFEEENNVENMRRSISSSSIGRKSTADSLYGLIVHKRSHERVKIPDNENYMTLIDLCIKLTKSLVEEITKLISNNLQSQLTKFKTTIKGFEQTLLEIKSSFEAKQQLLFATTTIYDYNHSVENFNFYGRAVFLTYLHAMNEVLNFATKGKADADKIQYLNERLGVISVMIKFLNLLAKEWSTKKGLSPFSDTMHIHSYEDYKTLDTRVFLRDLGTQYDPMKKLGLEALVRVTASYGQSLTPAKASTRSLQPLQFVSNSLYYMLNGKKAAEDCKSFFNSVTPAVGAGLWGLPEEGLVALLNYSTLPHVEVCEYFTIESFQPKLMLQAQQEKEQEEQEAAAKGESQAPVSVESVIIAEESTKSASVTAPSPQPMLLDIEEVSGSASSSAVVEASGMMASMTTVEHASQTVSISQEATAATIPEVELDGNVTYKHFLKTSKEQVHKLQGYNATTIRLRLISQHVPKQLHSFSDFPFVDTALRFIRKPFSSRKVNPNAEGCLIFHIHGGGFVAMQSFSHLNYLTRWAIDTDIPIVSCDYKLAPEFKYPSQGEECFHAYKWVVENTHRFVPGGKLKKIFITGDSAGGNLSSVVTIKAIETGFRVPDAVLLSYPAAYLVHSPSPARIIACIDPMVSDKFLEMCVSSYMTPADDSRRNAYLSPSVVPDEILKQFPPTYVNVGTLDPLFDDAWYFAKRIHKNNGGKVKLEVYDALAHGYMNLGNDFIKSALQGVYGLTKWLKRFIDETR